MRCERCKTGILKECKAVIRMDGTYFHNHKNQLLVVDVLPIDETMVYCTNCGNFHTVKVKTLLNPKGKPVSKCKHLACLV